MKVRRFVPVLVSAAVFGAVGLGGGMLAVRSSGAGSGIAGAGAAQTTGSDRTGVAGRIAEKGTDSITITSADGSSRTVYISPSTVISEVTSATPADLSVDTTVSVFGTSSGSGIKADRVTLGAQGTGGAGGPGGGQPAQSANQ